MSPGIRTRRLHRLLIATTLGVVVAAAVAQSADAAVCTQYQFIAARGSNESPQGQGNGGDYGETNNFGMGSTLRDLYDRLADKIGGANILPYGVHYPAVSVLGGTNLLNGAGAFFHIGVLGEYTDSVKTATRDTIAQIERVRADCGSTTKFVLAGYSQGAQAVADAIESMARDHADYLALIAGVALFADPYFNSRSDAAIDAPSGYYGALGDRGEFPSILRGKVFSYCLHGNPSSATAGGDLSRRDTICALDKKQHILGDGDLTYRDWFGLDFGQHGRYRPDPGNNVAGKTPDAANRLLKLLGFRPPAGTVPLDLVFAIDTTGSMGGTIAQVRGNITALTLSIAASSTNYRFALVDYKDFGDPYQSRVDLGFTTDATAFANAAATLGASGGGDTPESMYSGVMTALSLPWRNGVRKVVIVIGDAPGHDPEPGTGFTLDTVRAKALAVDPAQVYAVATGSDPSASSFMQALAIATGGQLTAAPDTSTFVSTLQAAITAAGSAPVADAGGPYTGITGDPVRVSADGSSDESEDIVGYDWDFDGDGTYDESTTSPHTSHTYPVAGTYTMVVRTRAASGLASTATATITIVAPPAAPATPTDLTATGADAQVTLVWKAASSGGKAAWFTITDAVGNVIDYVAADPDGNPPAGWVDTALTNGQAYQYRVSAGNPSGDSAFAGPVSAVPRAPNTPPIAAADAFSTDNKTPLTIPAPGVLSNDIDADGDELHAALASSPAHGTVSVSPDGGLTYTSTAGFVGTDTFTYKATDGRGGEASATVTVTVSAASATAPQRLVFLAPGKPPTVLVGPLTGGAFDVTVSGLLRVDKIRGVGQLGTGANKTTVSLTVDRSGLKWIATAVVTGQGRTQSFTGTGASLRLGRVTVGEFRDGKRPWGFAITDARK